MDGTVFWIAAVVSAVLVGMGKGGLPAVGMLAVPVLSLVISPVTAAGLLLPVYVVSDMFGLYAYRHAFDRRVVGIMAVGGTVGIGIGWATASYVAESVVTGLVGMIGAVFALSLLVRRGPPAAAKAVAVGPGLFWATIMGFTSFVSHAGGPPFQIYVQPLRLTKAVFAGTSTVLFTYVNAVKLIPYFALGQINVASLRTAAVLAVPAAIAVFAGVRLVKVLPEAMFFRLVTWALLAISIKLMWDAVR